VDEKFLVFLLVLSGATVWGISNVLRKYLFRERSTPVEVAVVATMLGASSFLFITQFIWFGLPKVSVPFWWFFPVTALLNIGIIYWGNKALQIEDASVAEPIQGTTPIFVILTSWLILRELPTFWGAIGILITVFGVYILTLKRSDMGSIRGFVQPWNRLFHSRGARLALLAAILGSISLNFDKLVVLHSTPAMRGASVFLVVAIVVLGISLARGQWQRLDKSCFGSLFGIGLLLGVSNVLMDWGFVFAFGIVPYVGSLKRFQIIVTNFLAGVFLHEGDWLFRMAAAAIIFGGIVLLAF